MNMVPDKVGTATFKEERINYSVNGILDTWVTVWYKIYNHVSHYIKIYSR